MTIIAYAGANLEKAIAAWDRDMAEHPSYAQVRQILCTSQNRIVELVSALHLVDEDVRHHLRSDEIHAALIRPHAVRAVRDALQPTPVT